MIALQPAGSVPRLAARCQAQADVTVGSFVPKSLEDLLELGDHEDHDHRDDADGDRDDHGRVDHGADDLLLELGGLFHEVGQAGEDQVEHAARLAGVDHVDVELVERLGVLGHRVGERAAAFDLVGHAADDRLEQARASAAASRICSERRIGRPAS